ncbi:MAG: hypothetical protein JWN64_776 [Parcubacteria group bacterium]|nr:hypothetical protein [Parcubacteria group bacterium]
MAEYRVTGKISYATTDPNGHPKDCVRRFGAANDQAAQEIARDLPGPSASWTEVSLDRIDVEEKVTAISL